MKFVLDEIADKVAALNEIKFDIYRSYVPGMDTDNIRRLKWMVDGLRLAKEAIDRLTPMEEKPGHVCGFCGRSLKSIFAAAEENIYCCPYCGQARTFEVIE